MPVGAASIAVGAGMTTNGFVADGDFGPFIMLSDVSNIATGIGIGTGGDIAHVTENDEGTEIAVSNKTVTGISHTYRNASSANRNCGLAIEANWVVRGTGQITFIPGESPSMPTVHAATSRAVPRHHLTKATCVS